MAEPVTIRTLAEVEAAHIRAVHKQLGGNMSRTAAALGIDRRTLYRKATELGLHRPTAREVEELRARIAELEGRG